MIEGNCNLTYMKPSEDGQKMIEAIRTAIIGAECVLREILEPARESSLALTKLEEACMWATKSVCLKTKV